MKTTLQLLTILFVIATTSYGQANTTLSNLVSPTSINQSLLPNNNNGRDLGSAAKSWRLMYVDSAIYLKDAIFMHATGSNNAFVGFQAGKSITTGVQNAAFGYNALPVNTTGSQNTALGKAVLFKNTDGNFNSGSGYQALFNNTHGSFNTASGAYSLYINSTGSYNTSVGYNSLRTNSSGGDNIAIGAFALYSNTTGYINVANGYEALYANTSGIYNVANGYQALYSNTTGNYNTALGNNTLTFNTTGESNTAIGFSALNQNTSGTYNTATGEGALASNENGTYNTASGSQAMVNLVGGDYNTAFGAETLYKTNLSVANTAVGFQAAYSSTQASYTVAIGQGADIINNPINAIVIGAGAVVAESNKARIGDNIITSIGGQVGWTTFSDGRYKKNIKQDVRGLIFINSLQPITYTVDINGLNEFYDKGRKKDSAYEKMKAAPQSSSNKAATIIYNGFIAQDVEKAAAKLNYNFSGVDKPQTKDGLYGLRYADFVVPLVKAVQELSQMSEAKDSLISAIKNHYDAEISTLQNQFNELKLILTSNQSFSNTQLLNTSTNQNSLQQNIPNPFTNTTSIGYSLAGKFSSAKIIITDKNGKALKSINILNNKGNLNVDASTLTSGAYQYSLVVDGKLIDTKQMILAK